MPRIKKQLSLEWVAKAIQGKVIQGDIQIEYQGVSTDSRLIKPGEIFFALKGERFDGHNFIGEVITKGASGAVIETGRSIPLNNRKFLIIEVRDTLQALGDLAACYRRLFNIPIAVITGSNGKTTTKEMVAAILSGKKRILKNEGNFNNLIGLPLSLLKLSSEHEVGVFELGMNRKGEIARLVEIASPTVGAVTNVGPVHLEYLKTIEAVAEAKGELFQHLPPEAVAVVNRDDDWVEKLSHQFSGEKIMVAMKKPAEIMARDIINRGIEGIQFNLIIQKKTLPLALPMVGEHNVQNTLIAAGVIIALKEDAAIIPEGLKNFHNLSWRQQLISLPNGIKIINDAYNANPVSMKKALETFSLLKGTSRGIAVLGDMRELGSEAPTFHRELGKEAAKIGLDFLLLIGEFASWVKEGVFAAVSPQPTVVIGKTHQELIDFMIEVIKPGDWVLVKGSRKMAMEKIIEGLIKKFNFPNSKFQLEN